MSWFYRRVIRPTLFTQDAEQIHNRTMRALGWAGRRSVVCDALESFFGAPTLPVDVLGLKFPNPVGLAAGMDKYAEALPAWPALGFGFTELGAVTWHPQPGNPAPRLFRAIADEAIVNRMGFNNPGAEAVAQKLEFWKQSDLWPRHPVGINLGKSKITPVSEAAQDYARSFSALREYADFFVVNVSSPNTPGLRQLQERTALDEILAAIQQAQSNIQPPVPALKDSASNMQERASKPILVKVAPDLSFEALDEILELVGPRGVSGIVATNTTISRPEVTEPNLQRIYGEAGGLSGRPLAARSTEIVRHLFKQTHGSLPIIGVGGVFDGLDAWEKISAGASLVQIYTSLVYEGPGVVAAIVKELRSRMAAEGFATVAAAVGSAA